MRTEYHAKLEDIDQTYHQKDQALEKERQLLERDLLQAREDLTAYGDEIEESITPWISCGVGQMSFRNTSFPLVSLPNASLSKS